MRKGVWFVAGGLAGTYAAVRLRRAAEALTYDGVHDRLSGLFVGARLFADQVRLGASEREAELRARLDPDYEIDSAIAHKANHEIDQETNRGTL